MTLVLQGSMSNSMHSLHMLPGKYLYPLCPFLPQDLKCLNDHRMGIIEKGRPFQQEYILYGLHCVGMACLF